MPVTELGVDERLARSASRKLRRYGSALGDCLNSVLLTIVRMPGMRSFSVSCEGDAITCSFPLNENFNAVVELTEKELACMSGAIAESAGGLV